jgi:tetratricopeptide (TPR) repeat protein
VTKQDSQTTTRNLPPSIAACLIALLLLLAYSNTFRCPFIFDDGPTILHNQSIKNLADPATILMPEMHGGITTAGRPLANLTLALNQAISQNDVWSYHAVNLLIHALAAFALFGVARRTILSWENSKPPRGGATGQATLPALAIALLWALHPMQTESVTYIVQRTEALMGLFYFLTLYCFARATEKDSSQPAWFAASIAACFCGMASKEVMASAPLVVFLYDRTFVAGSFKNAWQRRWKYHLALATTWLLLAALMIGTHGRGGTAGMGTQTSTWHYLLTQCSAIIRYLRLAIWPDNLVLDYGVHLETRLGAVLPQAIIVCVLLATTIWALIRKPIAGFFLFVFFAVLAPTSSFVPIVTQTIAEHRMYVPLAAIACGIMPATWKFFGRHGFIACLLLAVALGLATYSRNSDYRTETGIWTDTAAKRPSNARAHNNLGQCLFADDRVPEAMDHYIEAIRILPNYPEPRYNLGVAYAHQKQWQPAIICYEQSLRLNPDYAEAHNNLGNALRETSRPEQASGHYKKAIALKAGFAEPHNNLGNILQQQGNLAEAIRCFEQALKITPDYAEAHYNWGNAMAQMDQMPGAITHYREALRIKPEYVAAHNNLGNALLSMDRVEEAVQEYQATLKLDPAMIAARQNLAFVFAETGRTNEALEQYRELLRQMPGEQGLRDEITRLEALLK